MPSSSSGSAVVASNANDGSIMLASSFPNVTTMTTTTTIVNHHNPRSAAAATSASLALGGAAASASSSSGSGSHSGCYNNNNCAAVPLLHGLASISDSGGGGGGGGGSGGSNNNNSSNNGNGNAVAAASVEEAVSQLEAVVLLQMVWRRHWRCNQQQQQQQQQGNNSKKETASSSFPLSAFTTLRGSIGSSKSKTPHNNSIAERPKKRVKLLNAATTTATRAKPLQLLSTPSSSPLIPSQQQVPLKHNHHAASAVSSSSSSSEHWLWKSLRSYAVHERMAAVQLILKACDRSSMNANDDDKDADVNKEHTRAHLNARLTQCLVHMMHQHVVGVGVVVVAPPAVVAAAVRDNSNAMMSSGSCNISNSKTSRLAIEWSAALYHLLSQNDCTLMTTRTAATIAATYHYWPWLCRSIWTIATNANDTNGIQSVAALARVCHALTLHATAATDADESAIMEQVQTLNAACLWNPKHAAAASASCEDKNDSNDDQQQLQQLSPLACLIGAYFVTADSTLEKLVNCSSECVVTVRSKTKRATTTGSAAAAGAVSTSLSSSTTTTETALQRASREALESVLERRRESAATAMDAIELHLMAASAAAASSHNDGSNNDDNNNNKVVFDDDDDDDDHEEPKNNGTEDHEDDDDDDDDDDEEQHDEENYQRNNKDEHQNENHEFNDNNDDDEEIDSVASDEDTSEDEEGGDVCIEGGGGGGEDEVQPLHHHLNADLEMHLEDVVLDDDDDEDDEDDDMDLEELQAVVAAGEARQLELLSKHQQQQQQQPQSCNSKSFSPERRRLYIQASMQVLAVQHPQIAGVPTVAATAATTSSSSNSFLTIAAEDVLLESVCKIVKPPAKPLNTRIILRRAPTQEEFFRGSLSRNPVPVSMLGTEPTVADLRQHIANDLQMADSAELIEIIVANKILDVNLKLRVVHQVLWKNLLMENNNSATSLLASAGGTSYFSTGSALSIILTSGGGTRIGGGGGIYSSSRITADTPASALPPMVAMYRLAGVDGEATEDTVGVDDLVDPEAPSDTATPEEVEKLLEAEYGMTRLVTQGRGVSILLRSIQNCVADMLRRIRRDDVGGHKGQQNPSWVEFKQSPPCHGLTLLRHCSKLASNRKKLLQARAPTVLLTLLLDVLKVLEVLGASGSAESNPTAEMLQGLIEVLTSDISSTVSIREEGYESDMAQDAASMPLLLQSIETISLSPPLRSIIAKLLPFLTYGQAEMSRELARHFDTHIDVDSLANCEREEDAQTKSSILMNTFLQTAMSLPANEVCNSLRLELTNCGFIERLTLFIMKDMPKKPAPWSPALWQKDELAENILAKKSSAKKSTSSAAKQRKALEDSWRAYYTRGGLRIAFKVLTGLCRQHSPTQARIAMFADFLRACHWLEGTSDSSSANVETDGLGLLAETLLDDIMERNDEVAKLVEIARKKTRLRKKELSQERRNKALLKMSSFGSLAGSVAEAPESGTQSIARSGLASILAPVVGLFQSNPSNAAASGSASMSSKPKSRKGKGEKSPEKPAWLAEAELMQDEVGLTCAVCQEGRTLQPSELLGLYAYVKKVSIPMEQCGSRACIDGSTLLKALPSSIPTSLLGTTVADEWFPMAKAAASNLSSSGSSSLTVGSSTGRRNSLFTTTVSAGNGIHLSCHRRARQADRTHPKAPKSEWEGAALRNSRVSCNIILPLVTTHSSKVPLMAVDAALTDHMTAVSNLLGTSPKSTLWTVLHDVRFLILRIAYGESLSGDCGGGSLASNCQLLFYQFLMADMFDRDAQVDQPEHSMHARALSSGLLAACAIVTAKDTTFNTNSLTRGIADAATMAAITSIVFHNTHADGQVSSESASSEEIVKPHPKRQWLAGKDYFLQSLLICAGRRHARGMEGSGCLSSRTTTSRQRSSSFADWDDIEMEVDESSNVAEISGADRPKTSHGSRKRGRSTKPTVEDFQNAIRPMVTFYAIMEQLSAEYTPSMSMHDMQVEESTQRMVATITECQRSRSIHELLRKANVTMDHDEIIELLQKGMTSL